MAIETPDSVATEALAGLTESLGFSAATAKATLRITGKDQPRTSPSRLGTANAVALAAAGAGVSSVWAARTGQYQDVSIDVTRAIQALRSIFYIEHSGVPFSVGTVETAFHDYFRTGDKRWIWIVAGHFRAHHLDAALDVLQCPHTASAITERIAQWNGLDLEEAMTARKVPAALARTAEEWAQHPQGQWLWQRPVVEVIKIADGPPQPLGQALRPLAGIRVLDAAHVLCGPYITRYFAEHGADVLRGTPPHHQDPLHAVLDTNIGKRSAYLDLRKPEQVKAMEDLVRGADVMVQSWRPGELDRYGLGAEAAARLRPGLIYVSASCYGDGGPWGKRGGFDQLGQAVSGLAMDESLNGRPRQCRPGPVNDYVAAYLGAAGAISALLRRSVEGGSYHVKVSLARTGMWIRTLGKLTCSQDDLAAPYQDTVPPNMADVQSPFGPVHYMLPVTQLSKTPGYFARPPEPTGASPLTWP